MSNVRRSSTEGTCRLLWILGGIFLLVPRVAFSQSVKDQVGYTKLAAEVGSGLANGTGIRVGLVEADTDGGPNFSYYVDSSLTTFAGKTFTDLSNLSPRTVSGHANSVGDQLFGNTNSLASGVSSIDVYDAANFVFVKQGFNFAAPKPNPDLTNVSVMNHSYIGNGITIPNATEINARLDYTINRDNFTSTVALNNGVGAIPQIYGQSYNSIVVGRTDGSHSFGTTTIGVTGRTKPDIVAPQGSTSMATPVVGSAAILLHHAAQLNSMGSARNSEAMKAIIMAGATKSEFPTWSNSSSAPLDGRFGVGEVNVYNSYKILTGGEFDGSNSTPAFSNALRGWDYAESFNPSDTLFWNITVNPGQTISEASIVLTWNAQYQDAMGNFNNTLTLANMDLRLFDSTLSFLGTQLAVSQSTVDNVEHIYLRNLTAGSYTIAVNSNLNSAFGLAWNFTAVPEPHAAILIGLGLLPAFWLRRRQ